VPSVYLRHPCNRPLIFHIVPSLPSVYLRHPCDRPLIFHTVPSLPSVYLRHPCDNPLNRSHTLISKLLAIGLALARSALFSWLNTSRVSVHLVSTQCHPSCDRLLIVHAFSSTSFTSLNPSSPDDLASVRPHSHTCKLLAIGLALASSAQSSPRVSFNPSSSNSHHTALPCPRYS
jgi:hypothetical protein